MLTLTENATSVIRSFADHPGLDHNAGLRIAATEASDGLLVSAVRDAIDGDQVLEVAGARVFLEPSVAPMLHDKILDARVDDGGKVEFMLFDPPRNGSGPVG